MSDSPSLPECTTKEGDIDVFAMQLALQAGVDPNDTPLQKDLRGIIADFLTNRQPTGDPVWKDGLNPMVWLVRTQKGAGAWWRALLNVPPGARPTFEGLPLLASDIAGTPTTPDRAISVHLNDEAIHAIFDSGDFPGAADTLERAVTADRSFTIASFNAGVLEMALHNRVGAYAMLIRASKVVQDPKLKARIDDYMKATLALNLLLKRDDGSARRLYGECIDTAWALTYSGQYDLAAYEAGQAVVLDPDEKRVEAPLILAMCYSKKNNPAKARQWIQEAVARDEKPDTTRTALLNLLHEATASP